MLTTLSTPEIEILLLSFLWYHSIVEDANSSGNHMYELAEGRSKDIVGTTCILLNSTMSILLIKSKIESHYVKYFMF